MTKKVFIILISAVALCLGFQSCNERWPDDHKVRISWDGNSLRKLTDVYVSNMGYAENNLYYPRAKRLSDGAILLSYSNHHYGWDIYASRSEDDGKTWSDAVCIAHSYDTVYVNDAGKVIPDRYVYVNPDFIELQDGRLIMAFQWRMIEGHNDLAHTNEHCGIKICFSEDKGRTWSEPREVFRARCWEPAFLQLPSGEIQMYITDSQDLKYNRSYPRTIVLRSFDGGETWQGKDCCGLDDNEPISRTIDDRFAFDGMPSGVLLDDNAGIAVPLESWAVLWAVDQTPIIVKTTMEENWRIDQQKILDEGGPDYPMKKQVNKDFKGYGPYICKIPTGEVIVISNGTYKTVPGMWVFIGDKLADNFHCATSPFSGPEYWGNVDYIGDGKILATATCFYRDKENVGRGMVELINGRLNYAKTIRKGALEMPPVREFDRERDNGWWFLGKKFPSQLFVNFGYDSKNLLIGAYIFDNKISAYRPENSDGAEILISRIGDRNYKLAMNAEGRYALSEEDGYSWHVLEEGFVEDVEVEGTVNDDKDEDLGYSILAPIAWDKIGGRPHKGEEIKIHLRHNHKDKSVEKPVGKMEDMEGENSDYPCEWLGITLK